MSNIQHPTRSALKARWERMRLFQAVTWFFLAATGLQATDWFLLPEPKFMGHKVTQAIPDAKKTVLAVAKDDGYGIEFPTDGQWLAEAQPDNVLLAAAKKRAAEWFAKLTPEIVRDGKKVARYAVLKSDAVPVAATVFAPAFAAKFEPIFGPKFRVVIPNRQTVYIFPDLGVEWREHAAMIFESWRSEKAKVSLEVFEIGAQGLRAVGVIEKP
jgi:hypothetical protein